MSTGNGHFNLLARVLPDFTALAQHGDDRRPADAVVGGGHAVVVCARTRHCQQVTFM